MSEKQNEVSLEILWFPLKNVYFYFIQYLNEFVN